MNLLSLIVPRYAEACVSFRADSRRVQLNSMMRLVSRRASGEVLTPAEVERTYADFMARLGRPDLSMNGFSALATLGRFAFEFACGHSRMVITRDDLGNFASFVR